MYVMLPWQPDIQMPYSQLYNKRVGWNFFFKFNKRVDKIWYRLPMKCPQIRANRVDFFFLKRMSEHACLLESQEYNTTAKQCAEVGLHLKFNWKTIWIFFHLPMQLQESIGVTKFQLFSHLIFHKPVVLFPIKL